MTGGSYLVERPFVIWVVLEEELGYGVCDFTDGCVPKAATCEYAKRSTDLIESLDLPP
jgi:hypothetical protein